MNTIERYMFGRLAKACLGSTLAIVALVWTTQAINRIDFATGSDSSVVSFLHLMSLFIPKFISVVLPFGVVIGCIQILNTMNTDSEMPVLASAGYGRWRIANPVLLIGLIASAYVILSNNFVEPLANRSARDVITQSRTDLLTTLIQAGRFTKADKNLVIFVDDKEGATLNKIMISDTRDPELKLIYYAKSGAIAETDGRSLLMMNDGEIHRKALKEDAVTIIGFQSYAINLSQFSRADGKPSYFMDEQSTSYLMNPDPNDKLVQKQPGSVSAELHRRLTDWLYPLLMSLAALVLAGQPKSHRNSAMTNYFLGFGACLIYRGLSTSVVQANKLTADTVFLLYLIPIAGILISIFMFWRSIQMQMPQWILALFDKIAALYKSWRVPKRPVEAR